MKFPKLRSLITFLFFFLSGIIFTYSQVLSPPTLSSSHGSGAIISVCVSDTVTFTAVGDSGPTANDVEFRIVRAGAIIYPVGGAPGPQAIQSFSSSSLENGDQVVATVWTYDFGTVSANTNTITIALEQYPPPISFTSNATGNIVCNNETVELAASSVSTNTMFEFFVDGISIQGPSLVSTVSHVFSVTSTASIIASLGSCNRTLNLPIRVLQLSPGSISGGGEYCYADVPNQIISLSPGTLDGMALTTSTLVTYYQWQSSTDEVTWTDILNARNSSYTPPSLNETTHFRRKLVAVENSKVCEMFSNKITINFLPPIEPGYIEQMDQLFCIGDTIPTLTVSESTNKPGALFQWQQSTNNGISYSNIAFATAREYTPVGLTQTTLFRRVIYFTSGSGCSSSTLPVEFVLLDVNPGSLDINQNRTICYGTAPPTISNGVTGVEASSTTGSITYQWQQSIDNSNWSNIASATFSSYSPPVLTVDTYYRRAAISTVGSNQCSDTTNAILISVNNDIVAGTLLGGQIICENDFPTTLSLSGTTSATGTSYQWQMSTDNINFFTLPNSRPTLSFTSTTTAWNPVVTSYYRVLVRNSVSPGCVATSTIAEITVNPLAEILQTSGPGPNQVVCPGDAIVNATFSFTGSASGLSASGLAGSGLSFVLVGGEYSLSGTPTSDVSVTIRANGISPCTDLNYQYNVFRETAEIRPSYIRKGVNSADHTVFQSNGLWYNNTLCQNPSSPSVTNFYACQQPKPETIINHEWKVSPATAGSINSITGVMTWNPLFSGTATISVRALGCGGNSLWLDTPIEVIPSTFPATVASAITSPEALDLILCDVETGSVPSCQITSSTPNTRFFSTTAGGTSDYLGIQWSIQNISPGGGISGITNPGTIDSSTGEMNWNPGFFGSLDIQAQAINCDGSLGVINRTTIQLQEAMNIAPNIITVSPTLIPSCPPQGNYQTSFRSNQEVSWSINNSNAGVINSTGTNTAILTWNDEFSGMVQITATASGSCGLGSSNYIAIIPQAASIQTLTGLDDIQLCEGEDLVGIPYEIIGFPNTATVSGLPSGITGTLSATFHVVDIVYSGSTLPGQNYRLEILGQNFQYTTSGIETADQVVQGLVNEVSSSPIRFFDATRVSANRLRLQPRVAGVSLFGTVTYISGSVSTNIIPVSRPEREFILSGISTAAPGEYVYTITTEGGDGFCEQVSIEGKITIVGTSSLTMDTSSNDDQVVCDKEPIDPIIFEATNASFVIVSGLPPGVSHIASPTGAVISGTPTLNVTSTRVYSYTVSTINNVNGCTPEATLTGQITVEPLHRLELTSALGTDNQEICNSGGVGTLTPIEYTLGGGATNPPIVSGLPNGVISTYDAVNNRVTIAGTPSFNVSTTRVFPYYVTTAGVSCTSITLSGTITIKPNPTIERSSASGSDNQTGTSAVCNGIPIQPIQYTLGNAPTYTITGLPAGLLVSQSGNEVTISGAPNFSSSIRQIFTYTITSSGSSCQPEVSTTGQIEVIPSPLIDEAFINANDISHVSCPGFSDGAILIPLDSPALDLRIRGGQSPTAQDELIQLNNQPVLGDVYTISLNGINYTHTVIASTFGGSVQTVEDITNELISTLNNASDSNSGIIGLSSISSSSFRIVANNPGTPFSISVSLSTTYTGTATPTIGITQLSPNIPTNHSYLWTGPNGFSSSNLQINNLKAGDYTLRVTVGNCFNEASFTINEAPSITAVNEVCGGAFKTTLSGGTGPYTLRLYDANGNLLRTDSTNGIYLYDGLTPGTNYRLDVTDSNCTIPKQFAVQLPLELQYNPANVLLTHDYCQQVPNTGEGSIVLGTLVGNAFTGGSGNFSYRWTGPTGNFITRDIHNLVAGDYTVTVTDNELGCSQTETFSIASNNPLNLTLLGTNVINANGEIEIACANQWEGEIQISVSGGFGSYTYAWEKDGLAIANNTNHLQNLSPGNYSVTVTDVPPAGINPNVLCQLTQSFTLVAPTVLTVEIDQNSLVQPNCSGETVNIPVSISGGVPPYSISLNGAMTVTTSSPTYVFENLDPTALGQTVTITVEDQNECEAIPLAISINVPRQYSFDGTSSDMDCRINALGEIQLNATPSISASDTLIVEWSGDSLHFFDTWANGQGRLDQLDNPGTYTVSISTQEGCVLYSESFIIDDLTGEQLKVEIDQVVSSTTCNEDQGRIDLSVSNGYPPYTIQWEKLSNTNTWSVLNNFSNQAIITGLSSGTYRAIVSDSAVSSGTSNCPSEIRTRNIVLTDQRLSLQNLNVVETLDLCNQNDFGTVTFELESTLVASNGNDPIQFNFFIDGEEIAADSDRLNFNSTTGVYQINQIEFGNHVLNVTASSASFTCSIEENFMIEESLNSIQFSGQLSYDIDVCNSFVTIQIDPSEITGGTPFSGQAAYDLQWTYFPTSSTEAVTQTFFGSTINNALPGVYELVITDGNGCQNDQENPILIDVIAPDFDPISIHGVLTDPSGESDTPVKVIPILCRSDDGGQIGIEIKGGLRPFEINWFFQDLTLFSGTSTSTQGFIPLPQYKNQTLLRGLDPGVYKVEVSALNNSCNGSGSIYTFASETIEVLSNPDLFIVSGPFVDTDLCEGNPGRLSIEVFDNNQGQLLFYYNDEQLQVENNPQVNEQTYTLLIDTPLEKSELRIVNEQGCTITKELNLELGEASFSFSSTSLETTNVILAREEITFENTSTNPYIRSEWIFGDFSPPLVISNLATSSSVRHSYPVAGAYNVTLRIFNEVGCFEETNQIVSVGRGYSILLPNVFSPNNDSINDLFRPITTGLSKIIFNVYDNLGNQIYTEIAAEADLDNIQGIEINGWDGHNAPIVPYFIYTVEGLLFDGVTKVEDTGTFILLR